MTDFTWRAAILILAVSLPFIAGAQVSANGSNANAIPTAVPFLTISPDSRSGAMGDAGVALSPDVNANYWNPAKLPFLENDNAFSASYSPWLANLVPGISLSYLSYAHKMDDANSIGASLTYFNIGQINLTGNSGESMGTFTPSEFSVDVSYARSFGDSFSLGLKAKYIHSNLSSAFISSPTQGQGNAIAADASMYYKNTVQEFNGDGIFAFGADISNIGTKMSYSPNEPAQFLPTNLKIGVANTANLDDVSKLTFTLDLNKLLVPSNAGSDVSVPQGVFQSFSDVSAGQEFKELTYSLGAEYWYNDVFALRAGYFYQNPATGGRDYLTLGAGFKYKDLGFDFSYIAASQQNSPLANTLRFTLSVAFGQTK